MSLLSHFAPRLCTPGRFLFLGIACRFFCRFLRGIGQSQRKSTVFPPGFVSQQQLYLPTPLL
jgi:hypothetical protein